MNAFACEQPVPWKVREFQRILHGARKDLFRNGTATVRAPEEQSSRSLSPMNCFLSLQRMSGERTEEG